MANAAFFCNNLYDIRRVYGKGRRERIAAHFSVYPEIITSENIGQHIGNLSELEYIFSTWGMFSPDEQYLNAMPKLKAVLYAASSVKVFAEQFLQRGVQVVSAASANAEFVADYAASQIQLAAKGFFHNVHTLGFQADHHHKITEYIGFFEIRVGIIGAGFVGSQVCERIQLPCIKVCLYDPYLSDEKARTMDVEKVSLEEMFSTCQVVSNHAPDTNETLGMIQKHHFESLTQNAVFINTGRGKTVDEAGMIAALQIRGDLVAVLDVSWPEPPAEDSLIYRMPNIFFTHHIAGAHGNEVLHMADLCFVEAKRIENGEAPQFGVTLERLKSMA